MSYEIVLGRSPTQKKKYGLEGTIFLGKHYIQMEQSISLATPVYLDVCGPHVLLVSGKRGSGKSYSLSVIAEGIADLPPEISKNIATIFFDTMGIFWTMKYPNYRDDELLQEWEIQPKKLKPTVYVPVGLFDEFKKRGVSIDKPFAIKPADVGAESWAKIFDIDLSSEEGLLMERVLSQLTDFSIEDILKAIEADKKSADREKTVLENRFTSAISWGVFDKKGTDLRELFKGGQITVLDLSAYSQIERGSHIKNLVVGLICEQVLKQRLLARKEEEVKLISDGAFLHERSSQSKEPLIWMLIDECHEFLNPKEDTLAKGPLIQILREGRQPGITLVVATQQPGSVCADLLTQADIVISHRLTAKIDVEALSSVMQTYLPFKLQRYIDELPAMRGACIAIDDKLEKVYPMQVRPKFSWHGGEDPSALSNSSK